MKTVIEMAREAGFNLEQGFLLRVTGIDEDLGRFAELVRAEALAEQPAQQEPVAWMYQCRADKSGPVLMQHKQDWAKSGSGLWTEAPLYTSPPAQPVKWSDHESDGMHHNIKENT